MKKVFFFLIIDRDVTATSDSADSCYSSFDGTECVMDKENAKRLNYENNN